MFSPAASRLARLNLGLALASALLMAGCPKSEGPSGPVADVVSPKASPVSYRVLADETENGMVDYHVLIDASTKHDDVDALERFLYRYLMQRREDEPAGVGAYIYKADAAYRTPPRTPVGQVVRKPGENGPAFENKVPLEFWQEIDLAVHPRRELEKDEEYAKRRAAEDKAKLKPLAERDETQMSVTVTLPYTEPGLDQWADSLSFNQAMNIFTDVAQSLFENVQQLRTLNYKGVWKDKEVVQVTLTRADYAAVKLSEIDERIGQHHGRIFLELAMNHSNDKKAEKTNQQLVAGEYKALLGKLKGKAKVDPSLK